MHVKADRSGAMVLLAVLAMGLSACNSKWVMGSDDVRASPTPVAAAPAAPRPATVEPASVLPVPVVLAALVNDDLAARLSRADQLALERTTQTTLESVPIGTESRWNNPESGHAGTITPTRTLPVQVDGESLGRCGPLAPLHIAVECRAVTMILGAK